MPSGVARPPAALTAAAVNAAAFGILVEHGDGGAQPGQHVDDEVARPIPGFVGR